MSISPGGGEFSRLLQGLEHSYLKGPDTSEFEVLTREEALQALREHEREGLCHTVWTFHTPFIGGPCNCDRSDCIAMKASLTRDLVLDALLMAIWRRRPRQPVIVHSDQGSLYGNGDAVRFFKDHNLIPGMSRRGNCFDNAVAESFFSSLKKERIRRRIYRSR